METYGQSSKGQFWVQRVAALPTWSSADVGRLLLLTTSGDLYYANSTAWSKIGGAGFEAGVKMYFYQNTAPIGWVVDGSVADALIGVKGGVSYYNVVGGNKVGTWTQPTHTHTGGATDGHALTVAEMAPHNHMLTSYIAGSGVGMGQFMTDYGNSIPPWTREDHTTSYSGSGVAHSHNLTSIGLGSPSDVWRPSAAIGIIATKS